ncbi:tolloid-like protein 1 isoform X2 [Folsomia candida]|nr:tolloid-like protein 1 isoform X2 [Folsomia candida]
MGKFTLLSVLTLHILTAEIFADEGYPGFPSPFPTGANKSYYLHAGNEGGKVFLHFDLLDLQGYSSSVRSRLTIRNGNSADSPLEQSYSGNEIPPRYLSKSNKLFVSFITFGNGGGKGFFAKFVAYVPNPV